jgi:hypothetical protein
MFCLPDCNSPVDDILKESPVTGDENTNIYLGDKGDETYTTLGGDDTVFAEEGEDVNSAMLCSSCYSPTSSKIS